MFADPGSHPSFLSVRRRISERTFLDGQFGSSNQPGIYGQMSDALNGKSIEQDCLPSHADTLHEYRWTLDEVAGLAHNRASLAVNPQFAFNQTLPLLAR